MFYLMGNEDCINTFVYLSKVYEKNEINSFEQLKKAMFNFLSKVQDDVPRKNNSKYITDSESVYKLKTFFSEKSDLTDLKSRFEDETPVDSMKMALNEVKKALDVLKSIDEDFYYIFDLAITTLFYARSSSQGGGSVSGAVGTIWCSHRKNWSTHDIIELLVHELTHNLIFLDELKYGHYLNIDKMVEEKNYAMSSILNMKRPLDKAFHSLIVAIELLEFRKKYPISSFESIVHPDSSTIFTSVKNTIESIEDVIDSNPDVVTNRFLKVLDKAKKWTINY